jgi:hypothetical protein
LIDSREAPAAKHDLTMCNVELPLEAVYYPRGFPVKIATNSTDVLKAAEQSWGRCQKVFSAPPIPVSIVVVESQSKECPPPPICHGQGRLMCTVADSANHMVCDLSQPAMAAWVTETVGANTAYFRYHFLEAGVLIAVMAAHLAPIHAGCVELDGKGVLLCGDSEAGKSSLSFACARAGWTFVSDDACAVVRNRADRVVVGNPHQIRFRQSAIDLFPELMHETPVLRMNGEWAIELVASALPEIRTAPQAVVESIVFLRRQKDGMTRLTPFSETKARAWFEQVLCYGEAEMREQQRAALRHLLGVGLFEMYYSDLDSAVARLEQLVRTGS